MSPRNDRGTQTGVHHLQERPPRCSPPSSPVHASSQDTLAGKPKKEPTVTPRRFNRFFTPRTSSQRGKKSGKERVALGDITALATNRRGRKRRSDQDKSIITCDGRDDIKLPESDDLPMAKKRKGLCSPEATPERSSPLKRLRTWNDQNGQNCYANDFKSDTETTSDDSDGGYQLLRRKIIHLPKPEPIVRSRYRGILGTTLRREVDVPSSVSRRIEVDYSCDWRYETSNFYSRSKDVYEFSDIQGYHEILPFCTTGCNTNSLVAIGDEEGFVRLIESAKDSSPPFNQKLLYFRPHKNAILDLTFSSDDSLLATACGDQTSAIIDMSTQTTIYSLHGHSSSVKQVRFQPSSSNNVVATCSRDGNIQIWDLRCEGGRTRTGIAKSASGSTVGESRNLEYKPRPIPGDYAAGFRNAHANHGSRGTTISSVAKRQQVEDTPSRHERPALGRHGGVSITSIQFLDECRPHLLLSGSEANACVKLWDLRSMNRLHNGSGPPVSTTQEPESHVKSRSYGLTSIALSGDSKRLYTLARDNTVYVYSTPHLVLGTAPELELNYHQTRARRSRNSDKEGLGPICGFRHPKFRASTFYVKLAIRPARDNRSELLAVGSSNGCAVLFPTDERYLHQALSPLASPLQDSSFSSPPPSTPKLTTQTSFKVQKDTLPIYQPGTPLVRGHAHEVTAVNWTLGGELITVGDDFTARCWREDGEEARNLRRHDEGRAESWKSGVAEVEEGWDEEEC